MTSLKAILALALFTASTVNAHSIFHKVLVNGEDQGQLFGVRAPQSNSPIEDVTSPNIACNSGFISPVSQDVISVAPGDKVGTVWNHVASGPQGAGDADDPIAASHKGPIMAYMAKVDDASTSTGAGLEWFKVAEEGLNTGTGKWAVDTLIADKGTWSFSLPSLAPGDYLLRGEIIALHSAYGTNGAQFYMSCAAIRVTGSGTCAPTDTVSFPGAYSASDPGILISIYGDSGQPDNGGKAYTIPGPKVVTCAGGSAPAPVSSSSAAVPVSSSAAAVTPSSSVPADISITASVSSAIAIPTSSSSSSPDDSYPSGPPPAPSSSSPAAVTSAPAPSTTTAAPISFSSTVTGRVGKPTKFVCYLDDGTSPAGGWRL